MRKLALALLAAMIALPAQALDEPRSSKFDNRIRYTIYNPRDVVQLDAVIGIATHIVLEEGERYVTHAFGDAQAWSFAVEGHHVFIKPRADNAETNLTIVTDRRAYYFKLRYWPTRRANAVYGLSFTYPDTEARKAQELAQAAAVEEGFAADRQGYNLNYTMSGDLDIAPINAWDNNEATYLKFPGNRDIPAIYMVDADGNESIVNRTTIGEASDIVVLHKVNSKWILRLGDRALRYGTRPMTPTGSATRPERQAPL
jgi:type IV secretion system protein VirB9